MKKFLTLVICAVMSFSTVSNVFALTDSFIFSDTVSNRYVGRENAVDMISNLSYTDLPVDEVSRESIIRVGAYNVMTTTPPTFNPNGMVSNEEAITFIIRAIGKENDAIQAAPTASELLPALSPLRNHWSVGYLYTAAELGIITMNDFITAGRVDQTILEPNVDFVRGATTTRTQFINWLNTAIEPLQINNTIGSEGYITRLDVAKAIRGMDSTYYELNELERKTGTVGGIKDAQFNTTGVGAVARNIYVRNSEGEIDILEYYLDMFNNPTYSETNQLDAVVYKNAFPTSLADLEEGDLIEYIISPMGEIIYVQVMSTTVNIKTVQGYLQAIDTETGVITIKDSVDKDPKSYSYNLIDGAYGYDKDDVGYVYIDNVKRSAKTIPIGSRVQITLKNDIADSISYIGEQEAFAEMRGIVIENNPDYGYLSFFDNKGNIVNKNYYSNDIKVEKQPHYLSDDEIGYISHIFDSFKYNPRDSVISEVEAGDIVFMRFDPNDPDSIISLSASTDYTTRYGKIKEFTTKNGVSSLLIEYENKQTAWFDVANNIFISKGGRPIEPSSVLVGDWARILVNQAIIGPGYVLESVKEMAVENSGHMITDIVKGQLAGVNSIQNVLQVQNAQTLTASGWSNYRNIAEFSLKGKDIEFYHDDKRISLDYANQYLKRSNGEVYLALENNFTGDQVKKVTFRSGRDELLNADTVLNSDGNGSFNILSIPGSISTDAGTIVRRHGRLVDGNNILSPDYAVVSLNGGNNAAIVDIEYAPDTSGVIIARGRILSVDEGKSFKVQSMSTLTGNGWAYSPIQREFTIDYNTLFLDDTGYVSNDTFLDYTSGTVVNKVFNIVTDGSRASHVIDSSYANKSLKGTIYEVGDNYIRIKDTNVLNNDNGRWSPISEINSASTVQIPLNSVIVKNNSIVNIKELQVGQQVRIMTDKFPAVITGNMETTGYIILVEK